MNSYLCWRPTLCPNDLPDSHSAHNEFLWGSRAYAETNKWQAMVFLLRVNQRAFRSFPLPSAEAAREDDSAA